MYLSKAHFLIYVCKKFPKNLDFLACIHEIDSWYFAGTEDKFQIRVPYYQF